MKKVLLVAVIAGAFAGCAGSTMTISKCKSYKDGICVNSETKQVKECKNPLKINGKTYCEE